MKIKIIAFEPILRVTINEQEQTVPQEREIILQLPLSPKETSTEPQFFKVRVYTERGMAEQLFESLSSQKEKSKTSGSFHLYSALRISQIDNVRETNKAEDYQQGTKTALAILPQYQYLFSTSSMVKIKGIFYQEHYLESKFKDLEAKYYGAALAWREDLSPRYSWYGEVGYNQFTIASREETNDADHSFTEWQLKTGLQYHFTSRGKLSLYLQQKNRSSAYPPNDHDYDSSAVQKILGGEINYPFLSLETTTAAYYKKNEAEGKYFDDSSWQATTKIALPLSQIKPEIGYQSTHRQLDHADPQQGNIQRKQIINCYYFKLRTFFNRSLLMDTTYTTRERQSNYAVEKYQQQSLQFSFIHFF